MVDEKKSAPTFGSLFAGIGGIDLGLERAGWRCAWQVEINEYCRQVLEKHWPDVPKYGDITEIETLPTVDLIAGGFPCQDVSEQGNREGIEGARSGLWTHFARLIRVVRPRFVLVENVPGLFKRGMGKVLGDLAEIGCDAEWRVLDAHGFGVPQRRKRVFIVGYFGGRGTLRTLFDEGHSAMVQGRAREKDLRASRKFSPPLRAASVKHGNLPVIVEPCGNPSACSYGTGVRTTDGVPRGVDVARYRSLGNSVNPDTAEWIGRRLLNVM